MINITTLPVLCLLWFHNHKMIAVSSTISSTSAWSLDPSSCACWRPLSMAQRPLQYCETISSPWSSCECWAMTKKGVCRQNCRWRSDHVCDEQMRWRSCVLGLLLERQESCHSPPSRCCKNSSCASNALCTAQALRRMKAKAAAMGGHEERYRLYTGALGSVRS